MAKNQQKIDQAKAKKYGRDLNDEEKKIFDDLDEAVIPKVQEVLQKVIKIKDDSAANTTIKFDEDLLIKLRNLSWKDSSSNERKAYEAINKDDNWAKKAIEKLENTSTQPQAVEWAKKKFASDKKVFQDTKLNTATEVYQLAKLLNYVAWANKETDSTKKATVKGKLETIKNANSEAYKELKSKVDAAIKKLAGEKQDESQEKKDLETKLVEVKKDIVSLQKELKALEKKTETYRNKENQASLGKEEKKEELDKIEKAIRLLSEKDGTFKLSSGENFEISTGDSSIADIKKARNRWLTTATTPSIEVSSFKDVTSQSFSIVNGTAAVTKNVNTYGVKQLNNAFSNGNENTYWDSSIPFFHERSHMVKKDFEAIGHQIIQYVLKSFDQTKFEQAIDNSNLPASNKSTAKTLYKKLLKSEWADTASGELSVREDDFEFFSAEGINNLNLSISRQDELYTTYSLGKNLTKDKEKEVFRRNKEAEKRVDESGDLDFKDLFDFMRYAFPKSASLNSTNTLLLNQETYVGSKNKKWTIRWNGKKNYPTSNEFWADWAKGKDFYDEESKYLESKYDLAGLIEYFYAAFGDPASPVAGTAVAEWNKVVSGRDVDIATKRGVKEWGDEVNEILESKGCGLDEETLMELKAAVYQSWCEEEKNLALWKSEVGDHKKIHGIDYTQNIIGGIVSLETLKRRAIKLKSEANYARLLEERAGKDVSSCVDKEYEKKLEIEEKEEEKRTIEQQIKDLENGNVDELKKEFWAIYNNPDEGNNYTYENLVIMLGKLSRIEELDNEVIKNDSDLQAANKVISDTIEETKDLRARLSEWWATGDNREERLKNNSKDAAEQAKHDLEELKKRMKLKATQEEELKVIIEKLPKWDEKPSDLSIEEVKKIVGFDEVDQNFVDKWKSIDGKTIATSDLKNIIGEYKSDATKFAAIVSHVREKGVEGGSGRISEPVDEKLWKKFLKDNTAEAVVKTIVVHENEDALKDSPSEDKKNEIIKKMREDSSAGYDATDPKKNTFKKDRYGDPTEGKENEVTREQLLNYLFDKKIGNIKKGEAWDKSENKDDEETQTGIMAHLRENWQWYALGIVVTLVLLAVVFWKNISEWWNGPAEEQGEGEAGKGKKEDEEEE